jgi:hypothetical protein
LFLRCSKQFLAQKESGSNKEIRHSSPENDFVDERPDPRINIGLFELDFQCEDHTFSDIPDDIPEGFICVRFWCENMRWLLNEKPEDDMVMYEFPRWWEIGRIIKESLAAKKQGMLDLEERHERRDDGYYNENAKNYWQNPLKVNSHPFLNLKTFTRVSFFHKVIKSPTDLMVTEDYEKE